MESKNRFIDVSLGTRSKCEATGTLLQAREMRDSPPVRPTSPWKGWLNAEVYHSFVLEFPIYRELNRRLVELARLEHARRVLDLACGTGATSIAALSRLPRSAELVGVDGSDAMVSVARMHVQDPRVRFAVAGAADVESVVSGPFDRVLCNAAIWQFPALRPIFEAVSRLLSGHGSFVFNIPAERVEGEDAPIHSFQVALARAVERVSGRPFPRNAATVSVPRLETMLTEASLRLDAMERLVYHGTQHELMELMEIPAMIEPITPGLDGSLREEILERAGESIDPDERVEVPWIYFTVAAS